LVKSKQMAIKWNKIEANALHHCLDLVIIEGMNIDDALAEFPSYADSLRPELETALRVANQQQAFSARPGFISSSRKHLMQQIQQAPRKKGNSWFRAFQRPVYRLAFTLLMVFTIVLSSTGIASASALPGENMYTVKLSWENTRLNLTRDMEKEAQLHLRYADKRVGDVVSLVDRASYAHLTQAFDNYSLHTQGAFEIVILLIDQGKAADLKDEFVTVVSRHVQVLTALKNSVPVQAGDLIDGVLEMAKGDLAIVQLAQEAQSPSSPETDNPSETQIVEPPSDGSGSSEMNGDSSSDASGSDDPALEYLQGDSDSGDEVKDGDPDDGNQGGGNDGDKDNNPDDGNQGGGNDEVKDGDPDDGNQGGGNDGDKDNNPDDGNQGGGNDDKPPKEDKDDNPDDGNQGGGNDDKEKKDKDK
jgi:hypothetical protein